MSPLEQALLDAAHYGGGEPVTHQIPESARLTVTDDGEDMLAGLVVTHWSQD